jgi:hypothetical protein
MKYRNGRPVESLSYLYREYVNKLFVMGKLRSAKKTVAMTRAPAKKHSDSSPAKNPENDPVGVDLENLPI